MNIYLVLQDERDGYDTFDAMVVIAENEEAARNIHPNQSYFSKNSAAYSKKELEDKITKMFKESDSWASSPKNVSVHHIGKANTGANEGIVLCSFNAG